MTGVRVEKVDENGVVADGKRIPSATVLWTAGVAPSPIVKLLGILQDKGRRKKLYKQFIDEASKLYADALAHDEAEVAALVGV